jgi:hemolysin III
VSRRIIVDQTTLWAHLPAGDVVLLFDLREPINAWSHCAGMMLAFPVTWVFWKKCTKLSARTDVAVWSVATRHEKIKALCLVIFGVSLIACYGLSATFHGARLDGEALYRLQRLDHAGIFALIAGTYTPIAWGLMHGSWRWGTLTTVWMTAVLCCARVWCGGVMPIWTSTLVYLVMGWGALFCYFELAKTHSHRTLMPLPLGGVFYSAGAILNLARWPVLFPGVFAAHELFHFFVIAGSGCHVFFMMKVIVPAPPPVSQARYTRALRPLLEPQTPAAFSRGARWLLHLSSVTLFANGLPSAHGLDTSSSAVDSVAPDKVAGAM